MVWLMRLVCRGWRRKFSAIFVLVLAMAVYLVDAPPGQAQQTSCGERGDIIQSLKAKYAERSVATGLATDGKLIEVFASTSGTWTMLVTLPNGTSCYLASGVGWAPHLDLVQGTKI